MAPFKAARQPAAAPAPAARRRRRTCRGGRSRARSPRAPRPRHPAPPAGVQPAYLPLRGAAPAGASLAYLPMLIGGAHVRLLDAKNQVDQAIDNARLATFADGPIAIDWAGATDLAVALADLESAPREGAAFHESADCRARRQGLQALDEGLRRLALPDADGVALAQPVAEARLALGRVGGRFPRAARAGRARGPRRAEREAAREVRHQGRAAAGEAAHGAAGRRPRGEPGARRRPADRRLGRGLDPRRLPRAQDRHGRLAHDRRARRRSRRPAARRRQARRGERQAHPEPARRARGAVRAGRGGRRSRRRGDRAARLRRDPPQEGRHRRHHRDAGVRAALAGRRRASSHPRSRPARSPRGCR